MTLFLVHIWLVYYFLGTLAISPEFRVSLMMQHFFPVVVSILFVCTAFKRVIIYATMMTIMTENSGLLRGLADDSDLY